MKDLAGAPQAQPSWRTPRDRQVPRTSNAHGWELLHMARALVWDTELRFAVPTTYEPRYCRGGPSALACSAKH